MSKRAHRRSNRRPTYSIDFLERRVLLSTTPGEIFVSNQGSGTIGAYTTDGATVNSALVSGLRQPGMIAVSGPDLFVVDENAGVDEYTTSGATVHSFFGGGDVIGIAVSGSDVFLTNYAAGTISEFTTSGAPVNTSLVSGLNGPGGISVSGSDLFVAERNGGSATSPGLGIVGEYTTSGATVNASLITGLSFPTVAAVSGSDLFVSDDSGIGEYTTSGATVNGSLGVGFPDDTVAVSGSDLFVANYGGSTISEFTTAGATVNTALVTGLDYPDGICLQAAQPTGPAAQLAFGQQGGNVTAGSPISPAITVAVDDQNGELVSSDDSNVTLSIASGPPGATISGTAAIGAVNGVATFDDLLFNTPGTYTLKASDSADGLAAATSKPFVISPAPTAATPEIFVTNSPGTIGQYTTSGATVNPSLVSGLTNPVAIAASGSDLFVTYYNPDGSSYSSGVIGEYTTSGATVNASLVSGLANPGDIAVSGSDLFVLTGVEGDAGSLTAIGEYTTSGTINASLISGFSDAVGVVGIAVSGSNIFVASDNGTVGTIGEYTTSGATVNASLVSGLGYLEGIAVSGSDLLVAEYNFSTQAGTIGEYTTSGATVNAALVSGTSTGRIAVSGSVLCVLNGNAIGEYTTSGTPVNPTLILGLDGPEALCVASPQPQDSSFAPATGNAVPLAFSAEQVLQEPGGQSASSAGANLRRSRQQSDLQEPGGQILTVGHLGSVSDTTSQGVLEQLNSDGSIDTTFGLNGMVMTPAVGNDTFQSAAMTSNGQIIAVGASNGDFLVARYDSNGSLDTTFGMGGFATIGFAADGPAVASSVAIEPNGTIMVGGEAGNVFALARFTAAGMLDPTFNRGGGADATFPNGGQRTVPDGSAGTVQQILVDGVGQILGVGSSGANVAVFRLDPDGANDPSFGSAGVAVVSQLTSMDPNSGIAVTEGIAIQPDGGILVAGEDPTGGLAAAPLTPAGQFDSSFGAGGISIASFGGSNDDVTGVGVDPSDGQFLLVGTSNTGGMNQIAVAAFNPDGSVNTASAPNGQFLLPAPGVLSTASVTSYPLEPGQSSRPQAFHPQSIDFAFATFGADEKPLVGASGANASSLIRLNHFSPSQVPTPPSPVVPTLGNVSLSPTAVAGAKLKARMPVVITNHGSAFKSMAITINIFADTGPSLDGNQVPVTSWTRKVSLKTGKTQAINFNIKSLPAILPDGTYYLLAEVVASGATSVTATTQTVTVAAAFIQPSVAVGAVTPDNIAVGKFGLVLVTVTDGGNIPASGVDITLSPSSDGLTPVVGAILESTRSGGKILPGKSKKFRLRFKVTSALMTGNYYPYVSISLGGVSATALGNAQFAVG